MNAFCPLSIVPVRSTPSDAAEMVNQLLFGEQIVILEDKNNWVFIESVLDKYKGWVDKKQVKVLERPLIPNYIVRKAISINLNINHPDYFLAGSYLQAKDIEAYNINLDDCQLLRESISSNKLSTVDYAQQFLNAPYLWGGRSIFGIDCSGLTQIAFRLAGILIKRDAYEQALMGEQVANLQYAENGDLAFFNKGNGDKVTHVGIVIRSNHTLQIIHASGQVKIDTLTPDGIVDQTNALTHHFLFCKRITKN